MVVVVEIGGSMLIVVLHVVVVVVVVVVVASSETTTREVIGMLLSKFHIKDNPRKFALYEQMTDKNNDQGQGLL